MSQKIKITKRLIGTEKNPTRKWAKSGPGLIGTDKPLPRYFDNLVEPTTQMVERST